MFKRDQAIFITEKCGDSNRLYTLQGIHDHTSRTHSRGGPYVATFDEEELDPKPSLPRPGFAPPWRTPRQAWSQHGFQATTPPTSHFEWGNTRFKNLGQPSYIGLPVPFSLHANQYVQYLIKIKHAIDPYFFLWKWGQNQNSSSVLPSTTTIPVLYFLDWMEWTLC